MNRSVYVVVKESEGVFLYWDGSAFGAIDSVHLFADKLLARSVAAQMQVMYANEEVVSKPATVTITIGA
jgi:hypothetical protein